MKLLSNMLLIAALTAAPVAGSYAQHDDDSGMRAMSEERMSDMRGQMKEMNALMEQVKEENDPDKRDAILDSHAKSMEKMLSMMDGKSRQMGSGKKHGKMMSKGRMDTGDKGEMMEERMMIMEERMVMMEDMMEQMMAHTVENSKTKHRHKK